MATLPPKPNALYELFKVPKPIIAMVHSLPLPGAPRFGRHSMEEVYEFALSEARALKGGGVDGLMIENAWDLPFLKPEEMGPETVAAMSIMAYLVVQETGFPVGINILANAVTASLAVAKSAGATFARANQWVNAYVANEGVVEGLSGRVLRYRASIGALHIKIFADVHVKHGSHAIVSDRPISEQAKDAEFFDADVLIATGYRTGDETTISEVKGIKESVQLPVLVGSGLTLDSCESLLSVADGAIVGSYLKEEGVWWGRVSPERTGRLMEKVMQIRARVPA